MIGYFGIFFIVEVETGEFGVVTLGIESAFESFFFYRRAAAREEAADGVCDACRMNVCVMALSSSPLVSNTVFSWDEKIYGIESSIS